MRVSLCCEIISENFSKRQRSILIRVLPVGNTGIPSPLPIPGLLPPMQEIDNLRNVVRKFKGSNSNFSVAREVKWHPAHQQLHPEYVVQKNTSYLYVPGILSLIVYMSVSAIRALSIAGFRRFKRDQLQRVMTMAYSCDASLSTARIKKKTINFMNYDAYGFDLDHTVAKYQLVDLFKHAYDCVTDYLVEEKHYSRERIAIDLENYKDFICKGLFLDVKKGNILKLGVDGIILRATHGTRRLSQEEICDIYGKDMRWKLTEMFAKTLNNGVELYRFFENYFDCPGLVATARLIDIADEREFLTKEEKEAEYSRAWRDVIDALMMLYTPSHFAEGKGGYFTSVKKNPWMFVQECSDDIKRWLKSLKQPDKVVFLLTSSQIDYAACLLDAVLGADWQSYFDISLFHARKPGFFTDNNPFYKLEGHQEEEVVTELQRGGCYSQGNLKDFNKFLASKLNKENFRVLYFGDNICSDCVPSKYAGWGAVLVLEEMDAEGYLCSDGTVPGHEQDALQCMAEPQVNRRKDIFQHSSLVTEKEKEYLISDFWGPFLVNSSRKNPDTKLVMNTFWGDIISRFSDIAVPSLEYLAGVPLDHDYICFTGESGNTDGFHPGPPSCLLP